MSSDDPTKNLDDHALLLHLVAMFNAFDARLRNFDTRLEALEKKVDERLYDTRPMWEAVQAQMAEFRGSTELEFRKLNSKFDKLALTVYDIYADQKELERRVGLIESRAS